MKALIVSELLPDFAGVAVEETPAPMPSAGQVLVEVKAAALGFPDLLMTHGGYQHKPPLPFTPGMEGAGVIVELGDGVDDFSIGDRVVLGGIGTMAQHMVVPTKGLRKIPDNLDFAAAASVGSAYLTAYVALVRRAHLVAGEWLLIFSAVKVL